MPATAVAKLPHLHPLIPLPHVVPPGQAFWRGVVANWMVCIAVPTAAAANSVPGKFMAIWPLVAGFIISGAVRRLAHHSMAARP